LKDDNVDFNEFDEENEAEQVISFNLVIKLSTGSTLPSKWVEIEVSYSCGSSLLYWKIN